MPKKKREIERESRLMAAMIIFDLFGTQTNTGSDRGKKEDLLLPKAE